MRPRRIQTLQRTCTVFTWYCCRATTQGITCFEGLLPLRDHLVEVELLDVTLLQVAPAGFNPAAAAASIAQSLSRALRPERLTIRASPWGPRPKLMYGAEGPGPPLEFGPAWLRAPGGSSAAETLEEGGLLTRLRSLEVRALRPWAYTIPPGTVK